MSPIKPEEPELIGHSIWQPGPGARAAYIVGSPVIQIQPAIVGRGAPTVSADIAQETEAARAYVTACHQAEARARQRYHLTGRQEDRKLADNATAERDAAEQQLAAAFARLQEQTAEFIQQLKEICTAALAPAPLPEQRRQQLDAMLIAAMQEEKAAGARAADLWTAGRNSQRAEDIKAAGIAIDAVHVATARRRQLEQEIAQSQEPTP